MVKSHEFKLNLNVNSFFFACVPKIQFKTSFYLLTPIFKLRLLLFLDAVFCHFHEEFPPILQAFCLQNHTSDDAVLYVSTEFCVGMRSNHGVGGALLQGVELLLFCCTEAEQNYFYLPE